MSQTPYPVTMYGNRFSVHIDSPLYNGRLDPKRSINFGFSKLGCPYRGTTTCFDCEFEPVMECDYKCALCEHLDDCPCAEDHTAQLAESGITTLDTTRTKKLRIASAMGKGGFVAAPPPAGVTDNVGAPADGTPGVV